MILRAIRRALIISLFFAPPAHAWALAAAAVAWLAGTTTAAVAASTILSIAADALLVAASVGLSYIAKAIMGTPDGGFQGTSGKLTAGGVTPRTFLAGDASSGGLLVYHNTWGKDGKTPNAYYTQVVKISDLPITSLTQVLVGGVPVTWVSGGVGEDWGIPIPEYNQDGKDHLWLKFCDGTQTAADAWLVSTFGSDPSYPYSSDRIGYGVAYVIVTALVEPTLFSGWPEYKFAGEGIKLYDPRLDTTVGGDGSQRFDDQTTWSFSNNPKVLEYNVLRGLTYGGQWFYGLQNLNASRLPLSSWFAAMNECDLAVDNTDGGTEPQFRCGGEISVNNQPADLIDEIEKSCNGRLAEIGGIYKTTCGAAGSSVLTFHDEDLLSTEQQTFDQFPGLSQLINGITASFPDPTQAWAMSDAPARLDSDLESADGDRQLTSSVQYNLVPYAEQVQRLMKSALAEARRFRKHTIPLPPGAWPLEPLDIISWNSTRNGYSAKAFRVDLATDQANLDMVLTITEVDPADYDWAPETDYIPYVSGPLAIQRPAAQAIAGWSVAQATISGSNGRERPAIRLSWDTEDIADVDGVEFTVRLAIDGSIVYSGETPHSVQQFETGTILLSDQAIIGDTDYEVRGRYRPTSDRNADWSDWLPITTLDIRYSASDLYDEAISRAQLDKTLKSFQDFIGASARDLLDSIHQVSLSVAEVGLGSSTDIQQIRRQLKSTTAGFTAEFNELITAATGPDSALAQEIDELSAELGDKADASAVTALSATVTTQGGTITSQGATISSQGTAITANANAITSLNTSVGRFSASGIFRVAVTTTQSGADATAAIGVSASSGGSTYGAGIYLNARTSDGKTEVALVGSQTSIIDDSGNVQALFTPDGAFFNNVAIKDLTVDHLVNNTITAPVSATHSPVTLTTSFADLLTITTTTTGGAVEIFFSDTVTWSSSGPTINYQVLRDSTLVALGTCGGGTCPDNILMVGGGLDTGASAGSHTYHLQAKYIGGGSSIVAARPFMKLTELKNSK